MSVENVQDGMDEEQKGNVDEDKRMKGVKGKWTSEDKTRKR